MSTGPSFQTFSAKVEKVDINPYVKVPERIILRLQQAASKEKGPFPVKGRLQGKAFSATVVKFRGIWRLYLNTPMRRDARVEVGDRVRVEVRFDKMDRTVPTPRKLTSALSKNKKAREAFQKLAPSRQKEILRNLNSLKQPATLDRNIEKVMRFLQGQAVQGPVTRQAAGATTDGELHDS